tara:strand:+ start:143 stop:1309 length:1167 start_codon:yes stop_codon:yes gene_type:complete
MNKTYKNKIFIIVNSPLFILQHLIPIINQLKKNNQVYLLFKYDNKFKINIKNVKTILIPIKRKPSLLDFFCLIKLAILKRSINPNICISFTPKAGLINAFTRFSNIKTYHYFTGQRWVNFKGFKLNFYKFIDKFIIQNCDKIYCDSESQALFISKELKTPKPFVIGKGSISGVNIKKYSVTKSLAKERLKNKKNLLKNKFKKILLEEDLKNKRVFGFVGRLNFDKGINELIDAFKLHNKKFNNSFLLLIGPNELDQNSYKKISKIKNCFHLEFIKDIHLIMPCLSCLVLPSYREGFGSVLIEAAASKVPIITTDIPGPRDFIKHLYNGYLVEPKNVSNLKEGLDYFVNNSKKFTKFADKAFNICERYYSENYISKLFVNELTKDNNKF